MNTQNKLSTDDRTFFNLVSQAVFSNPFSDARQGVDRQIIGTPAGDDEFSVDQVLNIVFKRVNRLAEAGAHEFYRYVAEDRAMLKSAYLFDAFHRYMHKFDALILEQRKTGPASCPAPFAPEVLTLLNHRGFSQDEALRYFSMFYQLRRAYFLIMLGLVGNSPCMKHLRCRLWSTIFTNDIHLYEELLWNRMEDFATMLLGGTGTGKGTAAYAIGCSGFIPFDEKKGAFKESFCRSFVSLNLSQFPEALIESELFGHKKGAFTGAIAQHDGVFALCSPHGSIFLDEIGEVSIPIQIKLLQVLQDRVFSPVGSHDKIRFSGRVIAATNKSLCELRDKRLFRDDFYYRICSDVITVPSLSQRLQEDPRELGLLLNHLLKRMLGTEQQELTTRIEQELMRHPGPGYAWPGNVRELEQAVRRILLTHTYEGDQMLNGQGELVEQLAVRVQVGALSAEELLQDYCLLLHQRCNTYEEVARRAGLDRRTAKKYIQGGKLRHDK